MQDNIDTEKDSRAEIAALSHEVYRLTKKIQDMEQKQLNDSMPDKFDPFDNPTEYKGFNTDYSRIQPRITEPGYELPLEPDYTERKNLRKYYNIGGGCLLFQFIGTVGLSMILIRLIMSVLGYMHPGLASRELYDYARGSSILVTLNMLVYLMFNIFTAFLGMKLAKIKSTSLIRTSDFGFGHAFQYCFIGLFIWTVSLYITTVLSDVFSKYDIDILINSEGLAETILGKVMSNIYTSIIAPITEELLFRGMLLRVLSKGNQRFAIFASAFFFGLAHGNIPQFMLAFLIGIFLAHITMKHGSIIPSIIVHMFINTFSTVMGAVSEISTTVSIIMYFLLVIGAIFGAILFFVFCADDRLPQTTPKQTTRGVYIAVSSLPFVAAVVVNVAYGVYSLLSK